MRSASQPILGIVVPCFNEAEVLKDSGRILLETLHNLAARHIIGQGSFITFVDDGSTDTTWDIIEELNKKNPVVKGLRLAHNSGHQIALIAGLEHSHTQADILITIDADLQDDVSVMRDMVAAYQDGSEIVYGVRSKRNSDTLFKRYSAHFFYKIMLLLGVNIIYNHADFRLISKRVAQDLSLYTERNLFLRGIFPAMGFKSSSVYYERKKRTAGETKYPLSKMISFAFDGITSFSIQPLRLVMFVGLGVFFTSLLVSAYIIYAKYHLSVIPGWSSLIVSMYFLGGVQLFSLGLIGEYLGKIYREVKQRPRYLIETQI